MYKMLAMETKCKNLKDTFRIYINSKKIIQFEYDKHSDTVDGILNELVSVIDDEFDELNINQLKEDMNLLLKSNRINAVYYDNKL